MSSSNQSKASNVFFAAGLLVVFGFLVLILSNFATQESLEERAYRGDFDAETVQVRWDNLGAIEAEQAKVYDADKVKKAMASVVTAKTSSAPSDVVVPGSPTFMKQMEAASQETAPDPAAKEEKAEAEGAGQKPAPADKPSAGKESKPKPAEAKPKAEGKPAPVSGDKQKKASPDKTPDSE